jgi:hypothetical protein
MAKGCLLIFRNRGVMSPVKLNILYLPPEKKARKSKKFGKIFPDAHKRFGKRIL